MSIAAYQQTFDETFAPLGINAEVKDFGTRLYYRLWQAGELANGGWRGIGHNRRDRVAGLKVVVRSLSRRFQS